MSVCLSEKFVNMIQAELFQPGLSNLVHILLMKIKMTPTDFWSGAKGQGNMPNIVVKPCKQRQNRLD